MISEKSEFWKGYGGHCEKLEYWNWKNEGGKKRVRRCRIHLGCEGAVSKNKCKPKKNTYATGSENHM